MDPATAVSEVAPRFVAMVRDAVLPTDPSLGSWSAADVAMHLSHSIDAATAAVLGAGAMVEDVWSLGSLSKMLVAAETDKSPAAIAARVEASVERFLEVVGAGAATEERPWMVGGVTFPVETITAQVLSELLVHGYDVAKGQGVAWPIASAHAALAVNRFLFPALGALGAGLVDQKAAAGRRATFEIRVRGGERAWLAFDDGDLKVTTTAPPAVKGRSPVDCYLSVDPVAFLLVAWGRIDQWPAVGRGRLLAWGRRPWLGLQLRSLLRNP